jgi:hypothetical protein
MLSSLALCSVLFLGAPPVKGDIPANNDEPYKLAEAYLQSLVGKGDQKAREMHLGGMSWMAQTITLDEFKFISRDPTRKETGDLAEVVKMFSEIDKAARKALDKMSGGSMEKGDEGQEMGVITAEQAAKLMAPTKVLMDKLKAKYPVFAYVGRVEKDVYHHPKNPIRPLIDSTKKKGKFDLEVHRFLVESKDGRKTRQWGLKILRLKVDDGFDTQWKILPAADWNPDE